jgi:hypothetical protein
VVCQFRENVVIEIKAYRCETCKSIHEKYTDALSCESKHVTKAFIKDMTYKKGSEFPMEVAIRFETEGSITIHHFDRY